MTTPENIERELTESELDEVRGGGDHTSYAQGRNVSRGAQRTYSGASAHTSDSPPKLRP